MNPLVNTLTRVIYHGDKCPDGKCASWILWRLKKYEYDTGHFPIDGYVHGHPPPDVTGDTVAILDYCFPRKVILELAKKARHIYVLDHHASTVRDLAGVLPNNVTIILDSTRSGSEITWDWVYPGIPRPWFLEIISDRDLFRWTKPYSKIVSTALFKNGYYTWEKLELLFSKSTTALAIETLIKDFCIMGNAVPDSSKEIESACSSAMLTRLTTPKGEVYTVKLVACPRVYKSEVGNKLSQSGCDFVCLWQYDFILDEWWVSCRASDKSPTDLSTIVVQFTRGRGGGHAKSAGFTILGSAGENLQTYFELLTIPPSRTKDLGLLKAKGGFDSVKVVDASTNT